MNTPLIRKGLQLALLSLCATQVMTAGSMEFKTYQPVNINEKNVTLNTTINNQDSLSILPNTKHKQEIFDACWKVNAKLLRRNNIRMKKIIRGEKNLKRVAKNLAKEHIVLVLQDKKSKVLSEPGSYWLGNYHDINSLFLSLNLSKSSSQINDQMQLLTTSFESYNSEWIDINSYLARKAFNKKGITKETKARRLETNFILAKPCSYT